MSDYRVYCLDGWGRIDFADWILAKDDAAAVAKVREMKHDSRVCEVWQRNRLVVTLGEQDLA